MCDINTSASMKLSDFGRIVFYHCYSNYRYDEDIESPSFSLEGDKFTVENIKAMIEENLEEIFAQKYNNTSDRYFRLYTKPCGRGWNVGTPAMDNEVLFTLIGGEGYYQEMYKKYEQLMMRREYESAGVTREEYIEMLRSCEVCSKRVEDL